MEKQALGLFPKAMVQQFNDGLDALEIEERDFNDKLIYDFKVVYYEAETGEVMQIKNYSIEATDVEQAYELLDNDTDEIICDYDDDDMIVECDISLENVG